MDAAFWEDAPLAGITRRNLRELLLTRSQLQELTPLIVALAGHVGREMAEALLEGCFVRLRSKDSYILRRIIATHLPPEGSGGEGSGGGGGGGPLTVEAVNPLHAAGSAMPAVQQHHGPLVIPEHKVSDSDPFTDDAAYNDHGRAELLRHQAELAAAGHHRLGVPLHLTAAAAWRRKVALAWAARLQELVSTHGIGKMVADMNDHARLEEYLEAAIDHFQPQLPGGAALGPAAAGGGTGQLQSVPAVPLQKPRKPRSPTTGCRRGEPWAEVHEEPAQRPEPAPVPPAAAAAADATAAGQGAVLTEMPAGAAPVGAVPVAAPTLEPPPVQAAAALDPAFWGSLQQAVALATGSTRQEPFQPPSNQQPAPVLQQQQQQPMGQPPHMQQQPMELPPHLQPQQQQQPMVQPPHLQQQPSMALPPHVQQQQQQPGPRPWWHLSSPTARQPSGVHAATMQRDDRHPMPAPLLLPVGCDPRNVLGQGPFGLAAGSAPPFPTAEATTEQHSPRWAGLPPLRMSGPGTGAAFPGTGSVPAPWAGSGISPQATGPPQPGSASWQAQYILEVSGLPTGTKDGELAAYFRARFPSVLFARMVSERCGAVRFGSRVDRDAAVYEENGSFFADSQLRVDVPLNEPPPTLVCLLVSGLPPDATADSTAAYFRQRYPSVLSARVVPGKAHASAFVRFGRMDEREAAIRCQSDRSRFVLAGFLLHLKVPEGEHLWMHEQGRRLSSRKGTATVADLQPASAGPGLGLVDPLADIVAAARAFSAPASPQPLLAAAEMPAAEQKQAHVASSPDGYPLMIANVGASLTPDELLAYFRERYPSVCSASLRHGLGTVRFSSDEERHRARVEMDGHILPGGRKIGTGLPAGTAAPPVDATASHSAETAEAAAAAIKVKQEKAAEELAAGSLQQQPQQAQLGRATEQHPEAETGELAQAAEPLPQPAQPFPQGAPVAMPAAQPFAAALPLHPMVGWLPTMLAGAPAPYVAAAAAAAQGMGQQQHPAFNSGLSSTGPYVCLEGGLAQACPSVPATAPTSQADVDPTVGSTGQLRSSNSNGGSVGARMPASKPSSAKEETAKTGSEPGSRSGKKGSAASSPPRQQGSKRCRDRSHSRGRSRGRSRSSLRPQKSSRRSRSRGRSRSPSRRQDIRRPRSPVQAQPKGRGGSGWRSRSPPRRPDSRRSRSPPPRSDSRRSHSPPHRASSRRSRSPLRRSDNRRSRSPPTRRDNRRSRSPLRRSDNRRSRSPPTHRDNRRSRSPPHCPGSRRSRSPPNSSGLHKPSSAWTPRSSPLRRLPTNRSAERSRRSCSRERLRQSPVGRRRRSRSGRRDIRIGKQDCSSPEPSRRPGSGGALAMPAAHAACARERSSTPDVMQVLGERAGQLVPAPAAAVAAARGGSCTPDAAGVLYMKAEPLREVVAASEQQQQQVQPSSCCIEPAASSEHDMECSSGGQAPPLPPPLPPEEPGGSISGGAAPLLPPVPPPLSVESLPPPPPREEPLSPPPPPPPPHPRMAASPSSTLSLPPGFFPASGSRPQQQQQQPQQQQPELPHWVPPLFLEACHKVAAERGLPILDNELEDCMDFLYGQRNCLRNAGVTIHRVCLLMEERGAVRLRITTYHAYVVELL